MALANTWRQAEAWYRNVTPLGWHRQRIIEARMENNVPEHRQSGRRHCALPVQLHCKQQSYPTSGETTDVSLRGCYVKLLFPLPQGTKVDVRIALPDGEAKAKGVVRTLDPTLGNGIEFTEMEHASQEALELCLQEFPESTSGDFEIIR